MSCLILLLYNIKILSLNFLFIRDFNISFNYYSKMNQFTSLKYYNFFINIKRVYNISINNFIFNKRFEENNYKNMQKIII